MPYVTERWLGGMLTNWNTIGGRIKHLKDLEAKMESGELSHKYNKLEVQRFQEEIDELNRLYGGIKELNGRPGAVFVTDMIADANAVAEATKLGVPVVAIADTNVDPSKTTYPIPANDDAIKSVQTICDAVGTAIASGKTKTAKGGTNNGTRYCRNQAFKELTGVGLTDAKQALEETKGDFDKALKPCAKGLTKAEKRGEKKPAKASSAPTYTTTASAY